ASTPVLKSARNRMTLFPAADGVTRTLGIIYDDDPNGPTASQVKIDRNNGGLAFGTALDPADKVTAWYAVDPASACTVVLTVDRAQEEDTVVSGDDLIGDLSAPAWGTATAGANSAELRTRAAGAPPLVTG